MLKQKSVWREVGQKEVGGQQLSIVFKGFKLVLEAIFPLPQKMAELCQNRKRGKMGWVKLNSPAQFDLGGGSCYRGYRPTIASPCAPKGQVFIVWKIIFISGQSQKQHTFFSLCAM